MDGTPVKETPIVAMSPEDIVIAVMGITGSGKSSFINLLVDGDVGVGHQLTSCTAKVEMHCFVRDDGQRIFLIDTPGFDDTNRTDTEVLKEIAFFLSRTYQQNIQLTGIIYLHRITDNRMAGSSVRNLSMFKKLCGGEAYRAVALATTMWGNLSAEGSGLNVKMGEDFESQLIAEQGWWGAMKANGSQVRRHTGERESALSIVNDLIATRVRKGAVTLDIQRELVDRHLSLEDTGAGQEVQRELHKIREKYQSQLATIKESYEEALEEKNQEVAEELLKQRQSLENEIVKANQAREDLKISLEKLSEEKTAQYNRLAQELQQERQEGAQRLAEQQALLKGIEAQRASDAEKHRKDQAEFEQKIRDAQRRADEKLEAKDLESAKKIQEDKRRYEEEREAMEKRFEERFSQQQQKADEVQSSITEQKKKRRKREYVLPVLSLLAGVGTSVAGVVLIQPGMVMSGFGMMGSAFSGGGGQ